MSNAESYFEDLLMRVIEGVATEEEFATFSEIIRMDAGLRRRYAREMRLHALLSCQGDANAFDKDVPLRAASPKRGWPEPSGGGRKWLNGWLKVAAAAAVLVSGAAVWYAADISTINERFGTGIHAQTEPVLPAVRLVSQKAVKGLDVPATVPGTLRLGSGEVVVRLDTGVELTLLGPLELDVRDAMKVRLDSGRLLAAVPSSASGFTVLTRELEIVDIGTIFGVKADAGRSDVFVYKGSVQVNESCGEPVDLCEAGEGVRTLPGRRTLKVAADWSEARKIFAAVRGAAALFAPDEAFDAADRIAGLWIRRYMPIVVPPPPPPVAGLRGTVAGSRKPAKGSWQSAVSTWQSAISKRESVIPSQTVMVPRAATPQRKESEMRGVTNTMAAVAAAALAVSAAGARTIEIVGTNINDDVVTSIDIAFGAADAGETNLLFAVWGPTVGGEGMSGWAHCGVATTVLPETETFRCPMPTGWETDFRAIRFHLVPKPKAYDYALDYIESTGSEYVNTGCTHSPTTVVECALTVLSGTVGDYNTPFGSRGSAGNKYPGALYFFTRFNKQQKPGFFRGNNSGEVFGNVGSFPVDKRVALSIAGSTAAWSTNGVAAGSLTCGATPTDGIAPMLVFTMNETAETGGVTPNTLCNTKMRLHAFKMTDGADVRCDLVPVVRDGTGMLYDRATGTFCGNISGKGAFRKGEPAFDAVDVVASTEPFYVAPERTVTIAETNVVDGAVVSVRLAFGPGAEGRTNILFAAYGPLPGGDGANGWAHCDRVAAIAPETDAYVYPMPAGWGTASRAIRFFLAAPPTGYDSAVEYLESTGSEYVNTGCTHSSNTVVECEADILSNTVGAYNTPFGSRKTPMAQGLYFFTRYNSVEKPGIGRGGAGCEKVGAAGAFPTDVPLTIRVDGLTARWATNRVVIGSVTSTVTSAYNYNGFAPMFVFTMNETATEGGATANTACNTKMRLRSFRLTDAGTVRCDLVPVVKNGAGLLYDKATSNLLANASGIGAFLTGSACYGGERVRAFSERLTAPTGDVEIDHKFAYRAEISFPGYAGKEHLAGFPALLFLSPDAVEGFRYDQCAADGSDVRITDPSGTLLPHEIEQWDTNGTSYVWVRLPSLAPSGTSAVLHWGVTRRALPAALPASAVWSDYLAVWHFGEDAGTARDSGPWGFHAQPQGDATGSRGTNVIALGRSRYIPGGWFDAGACAKIALGSSFSASGWFYMKNYKNGDSPLLFANKTLYNDAAGWYFAVQEHLCAFSLNGGGTTTKAVSNGPDLTSTWRYLVGVFDGNAYTIYNNEGKTLKVMMKATGSAPQDNFDTLKLFLDTYGTFTGFADEMRIRIGKTSEDRVAADIKTMSDAGFAVFGVAEKLVRDGTAIFIR